MMDITGSEVLSELHKELAAKEIELVIAESKGRFQQMMAQAGLVDELGESRFFPTVHLAVKACRRNNSEHESLPPLDPNPNENVAEEM
jgi:hypothetical protein